MTDLQAIALTAASCAAAVLAGWVWIARALARKGASRWRAVPLALPLLLLASGYGAFWAAFFASPSLAVQTHAIRLTVSHFAGPAVPWLAGLWLLASAWALRPLVR